MIFSSCLLSLCDRLYGLVVIVSGYRSRGPGFDSRHYQILREVLVLGRGPLSLLTATEELLGRGSSGSGLEIENTEVRICHADHVTPSILKSWH
jgi:hypothetical protein